MDKRPADTELLESDVDGVLGGDPSPHEFKAIVLELKAQKCSETTDGQIHPLEVWIYLTLICKLKAEFLELFRGCMDRCNLIVGLRVGSSCMRPTS